MFYVCFSYSSFVLIYDSYFWDEQFIKIMLNGNWMSGFTEVYEIGFLLRFLCYITCHLLYYKIKLFASVFIVIVVGSCLRYILCYIKHLKEVRRHLNSIDWSTSYSFCCTCLTWAEWSGNWDQLNFWLG